MPTTYTVFSLGTGAIIDPIDGNTLAEDADLLVGLTFGAPGSGLNTSLVTMSAPPNITSGITGVYDQDNDPDETFLIDGVSHTFDATAIYNATITYMDGTTATITAVIVQDTDGNLYWVPELDFNADQAAIESKKILSLTLDSLESDNLNGLTIDRWASNPVPCFVEGTLIETPDGPKPIESLVVGDMVVCLNDEPQSILWIGSNTVMGAGKLAPVRIGAGALGENLPHRDLLVSRQHRLLISSKVCERMFGATEVLVPAIKLTVLPGIFVEENAREVTYYHIKTKAHSVIYAEGAPSETLLLGPQAIQALGPEAIEELGAIFPDLFACVDAPAHVLADGERAKTLLARHIRNQIPCLPGATYPGSNSMAGNGFKRPRPEGSGAQIG